MILEKPFIDFEVETPDSTIHHLSDYAGKGEYVLLDFWHLGAEVVLDRSP